MNKILKWRTPCGTIYEMIKSPDGGCSILAYYKDCPHLPSRVYRTSARELIQEFGVSDVLHGEIHMTPLSAEFRFVTVKNSVEERLEACEKALGLK